jgi:hypothetical protein
MKACCCKNLHGHIISRHPSHYQPPRGSVEQLDALAEADFEAGPPG